MPTSVLPQQIERRRLIGRAGSTTGLEFPNTHCGIGAPHREHASAQAHQDHEI